jgi:glycosyltransferase involved in cell wall biosynthesis
VPESRHLTAPRGLLRERGVGRVVALAKKAGDALRVACERLAGGSRQAACESFFSTRIFPRNFVPWPARWLGNSANEVAFITAARDGEMEGVEKLVYRLARAPRQETHHYLRNLELAVLHGQAAARSACTLQARGFVPDVICGHSGWGSTLFMKDLFPQQPLLCAFEWFYHARGTDADFDPAEPLTDDDAARIRVKNAAILLDLASCDAGTTPTQWQQRQFPAEFQAKLEVCHEGIDTGFFRPAPQRLALPRLGLDLSHTDELVTYVARGMEPYRGFPQFIEAMHRLLAKRPRCHVVIVGEDRVAYGRKLPRGESFKKALLARFPLDPARVHFTGLLPYGEYVQVLQASSAHVYLTRPFVLSWSMLEAMSAGCLVVASRTPPVQEVIEDGINGLLADFFSPEELADRVEEALANPAAFASLRRKARATVVQKYSAEKLLPRRVAWIKRFVR